MTIATRNRINRLLYLLSFTCVVAITTIGYSEGVGDAVIPSAAKIDALGAWGDAKIMMLTLCVIATGSLAFAYHNNKANQAAMTTQAQAYTQSLSVTCERHSKEIETIRAWSERMNDKWADTVERLGLRVERRNHHEGEIK